ncbi:CBN-DMD-10 protein, partial [Aphelenchoides avenae]
HKANCPYIQCQCAKCLVVVERQRLMADQIKLRRRQKKMRAMRSASDPSTIPASNARSLPARSEKVYDTHSANRFANSA